MLDRVIFFTLLPYFYDILDIIKYDCSRKSAKEILFNVTKKTRKAARERRAKEREHEAKVAHYKKILELGRPALIIVVIVGLTYCQRTRFQTTLCQKCLGGYLHSLIGRIRLISLHFGFCLFADRHFPHH